MGKGGKKISIDAFSEEIIFHGAADEQVLVELKNEA